MRSWSSGWRWSFQKPGSANHSATSYPRMSFTPSETNVNVMEFVSAWRVAFDRPRAALGLQPEAVGGAATWVVPNPSGLNAHYQLPDLARIYGALRPAR